MLKGSDLSYRVGEKVLVSGVSVDVQPGQVWALLGPNGAGKTTLLRMLSGQLTPFSGSVTINDTPFAEMTPCALARRRALLSQSRSVGFPFTVFEVVMLGRHPQCCARRGMDAIDERRSRECLRETDADHLSDRVYNSLSGGEAGRVDLARVLAQDAPLLLLDEPTNHLDPRHQIAVLALCEKLAQAGHAVVACLHDLALAARFATNVLLLKQGRVVAQGSPAEVMTADTLQEVYDMPFDVWTRPEGTLCVMPSLRESIIEEISSEVAPVAAGF